MRQAGQPPGWLRYRQLRAILTRPAKGRAIDVNDTWQGCDLMVLRKLNVCATDIMVICMAIMPEGIASVVPARAFAARQAGLVDLLVHVVRLDGPFDVHDRAYLDRLGPRPAFASNSDAHATRRLCM